MLLKFEKPLAAFDMMYILQKLSAYKVREKVFRIIISIFKTVESYSQSIVYPPFLSSLATDGKLFQNFNYLQNLKIYSPKKPHSVFHINQINQKYLI